MGFGFNFNNISFMLGFYMCKLLNEHKKDLSHDNFKIINPNIIRSNSSGIDLEEEKELEDYKNCLEDSRYYVQESTSILENPEDYSSCYEAIEEALGQLENTDFCGL